jgi:hypothetical protein
MKELQILPELSSSDFHDCANVFEAEAKNFARKEAFAREEASLLQSPVKWTRIQLLQQGGPRPNQFRPAQYSCSLTAWQIEFKKATTNLDSCFYHPRC